MLYPQVPGTRADGFRMHSLWYKVLTRNQFVPKTIRSLLSVWTAWTFEIKMPRKTRRLSSAWTLLLQVRELRESCCRCNNKLTWFIVVYSCLLPIWTLYEGTQLHDSNCGSSCDNKLKDIGKLSFGLARDKKLRGSMQALMPGPNLKDDWDWLFKGRIPGILQIYSALGAELSASPSKRSSMY